MLPSYMQIGQNHLHFEELASTNIAAANLLANTTPIDGTVISADFQTAGKGQYDRKWHSARGENIIMSIILIPKFLKVNNQIYLNMAIALAIIDYLNSFSNGFTIKWPNDILHHGKKIAGILIQNQLQGASIKASIVGLGINVNQTVFDPILTNATSLKKITKCHYDPDKEMKKLWHTIERRYQLLWKESYLPSLRDEYHRQLLGYNKPIQFKLIQEEIVQSGTLVGVNDTGKLIVRNEQHKELFFTHGEVELQYPPSNFD